MLKVIAKVIASKWWSWDSNQVSAHTYILGCQSTKKQKTELIFLKREIKGREMGRKRCSFFVTLSHLVPS